MEGGALRDQQLYHRDSGEFDTYSALTVQHFMNPRNTGRLEGADGRGCTTSHLVEDFVEISIRVDGQSQRIVEARFRAVGSPAVMACASLLTDLIKGRTVLEAGQIEAGELETELGGLPPRKRVCAELPITALQAAVEDYQQRRALNSVRRRAGRIPAAL